MVESNLIPWVICQQGEETQVQKVQNTSVLVSIFNFYFGPGTHVVRSRVLEILLCVNECFPPNFPLHGPDSRLCPPPGWYFCTFTLPITSLSAF